MIISSKRGGIFRNALFLAAFLMAGSILSWMFFLPYAVRSSLGASTGYEVAIETVVCNPLGFEFRAENISLQRTGSEPWLALSEVEATAKSPFKAREREFETLLIDAEFIRLEIDEAQLFNLSKLINGLKSAIAKQVGAIEIEAVMLKVGRLELVDNSGFLPKRKTLAMNLEKGPYPAQSFVDIFQPLLEELAGEGIRPL